MIKQLKISYESMQQNSYLVVNYGTGQNIVRYQLEMITANAVSHFLTPQKQTLNGETIVYYQISSKIPLGQILERSKIKKEELLRILDGAVQAIRDAAEYQLNQKGIVMDADYIYVNPSTFEPYFVYLPLASADETDIRGFLQALVMQGKIALTTDNFIQVLLEMINAPSFSIESLEEFVKQFRLPQNQMQQPGSYPSSGMQKKPTAPTAIMWQQLNSSAGGQGSPYEPTSITIPVQPYSDFPGYSGTADMPPVPPIPPQPLMQPLSPVKAKEKKGKKKEPPVKKEKREKLESSSEDFDAEKAKKKFLLPQAVIMVSVAALISFGGFTDEAGHIVLNNILAAVLIIGVAEVVLYREAYVNSRKKAGKEKGKEKKESRPAPPVFNGSASKPAPPRFQEPVGQVAPPRFQEPAGQVAPPRFQESACQAAPPMFNKPAGQAVPYPVNQAAANPAPARFSMPPAASPIPSAAPQPQPGVPYASGMVNPVQQSVMPDTETEIWDDDQAGGEAYLEYYENGMLTRVVLNKPHFLIGRLKNQVDFAVSNTKVGKIHAEFLNQNGRVYVKDYNSKNGTYINGSGERIQSNIPYPLKDQDRIALANSEFTLRCPVN